MAGPSQPFLTQVCFGPHLTLAQAWLVVSSCCPARGRGALSLMGRQGRRRPRSSPLETLAGRPRDDASSDGGDSVPSAFGSDDSDFNRFTDGAGVAMEEERDVRPDDIDWAAWKDWYVAGPWQWAAGEPKSQHAGSFGVLVGNWGGHRRDPGLTNHLQRDIKSEPAQFLCLQEAHEGLKAVLERPVPGAPPGQPAQPAVADAGAQPAVAGDEENPAVAGGSAQRAEAEWVVIRGDEPGNSCLIAARESYAPAARLRLWWLRHDGIFRNSRTKRDAMAMSRILVVTFQLRKWAWPTDGSCDDQEDTLTLATVHLHHMTAKKGLKQRSAERLSSFWDALADAINYYSVRVVSGDFNMSLFAVVPQLRARGVMIHMAGWYPWQPVGPVDPKFDSMGIFWVGPAGCVQPSYKDFISGSDADAAVAADPREMPRVWQYGGSGYELRNYVPRNRQHMEHYVKWTFAETSCITAEAVNEVVAASSSNRDLFPIDFRHDYNASWRSYYWASVKRVNQKMIDTSMFDPNEALFGHNSHMPLLVFIQPGTGRRSPKARAERAAARAQTGHGPWSQPVRAKPAVAERVVAGPAAQPAVAGRDAQTVPLPPPQPRRRPPRSERTVRFGAASSSWADEQDDE